MWVVIFGIIFCKYLSMNIINLINIYHTDRVLFLLMVFALPVPSSGFCFGTEISQAD
jgi:hypothetical protein